MTFNERPLTFTCDEMRMLGVLSEPACPSSKGDVGMVIVVGGPQVRAGSHRQFVLQARAAAASGVPTLRFDVRGMGDSEGEMRGFEQLGPDIGAAIDALQRAVPEVRRVVLWGLCDGASAALLYLDESAQDPRVQGLVLLNPWVRSEETLAATHLKHYYAQRLLKREFWAKLMRGQVAGQALRGLARSVSVILRPVAVIEGHKNPAAPYVQRMARALSRFGGRVLLVLSGNDYTAKEFLQAWGSGEWAVARTQPRVTRIDLEHADHTFSDALSQQACQNACNAWLADLMHDGKVAMEKSPNEHSGEVHAHN